MQASEGKEDEQNDSSIYKTYFQLTEEYIEKYGKNTIVLLQVGSFFEIYGLMRTNTGGTKIYFSSLIEEMSQITNLAIAEKKYTYNGFQVVMSGFRDYFVDKYLQKITDANYTAVVYIQERIGDTKKYTRVFHSVHSPGTYLSCETEMQPQPSNNITCIWFEVVKPTLRKISTKPSILYGVSSINIYTGQSTMFEYQTAFEMNPTSYDELERAISTTNPNEVIVIGGNTDITKQQCQTILEQYIGVSCKTVHYFCIADYVDIENKNQHNKTQIEHCTKQKYIREILGTYFSNDIYEKCEEFRSYQIATQSFCFLLNFIQEHNPQLVKKIELPNFNNTSYRTILANHTLKQLNIINDNNEIGAIVGSSLSSVSNFLNKCSTAIGRRRFYEQLVNPVFDIKWLNQEYEMIKYLCGNNKNFFIDMFRQKLREICDIEKIMRQIVAMKIYPQSISKLVKSLESALQISLCLSDDNKLNEYLWTSSASNNAIETIDSLIKFIRGWLDIDICASETSMLTFENNIICEGRNLNLDVLIKTHEKQKNMFIAIRNYLNDIMKIQERNAGDMDYIKIHETEKNGAFLLLTKKRSATLKKYLDSLIVKNADANIIVCGEIIPVFSIQFKSYSTTTDEINIPILDTISRDLLQFKEKINSEIKKSYMDFLVLLEQKYNLFESVVKYIGKIDIIQNKTYIACTYNYCMPQIYSRDSLQQKSFVHAYGMRHCLIEHIQQNELYVDNDILLGNGVDLVELGVHNTIEKPKKSTNGILLYGTNAVGKTSLIRALGICVIMAQAGMFVPCSEFVYYPYKSIFTRILGNDNLFKGLSTFAVEMSELRVILKMADEYSLILGDELCSGTETESALSIMTAGLLELSKKKSHYIFATHFHEIVHFDEIKQLCGEQEFPYHELLSLKHMSVIYNRELECLIYDRKLKDGAGTRMYGLEVCKYLQLPDDFLEEAYSVRNKYFPETQGALSFKTARKYNSEKIRGVCEMCRETMGEEIHHMQEQKTADENGYIGGKFHKNHSANLMSLCEKCHLKIHHGDVIEKDETDNTKTTATPTPTTTTLLKKKSLSKKGYVIIKKPDEK